MNLNEAILKRRSTGSYLDKQLAEEDLQTIISAGRWAPIADPCHLSVVTNMDLMDRINAVTLKGMLASGDEFLMGRASLPGYLPLYGAPAVMILSGPTNSSISPLNCAVALEGAAIVEDKAGSHRSVARFLPGALHGGPWHG